MHRYAVYYAPPEDHPLWEAGCSWLGRDPRAGQPLQQPPSWARSAWRYGWHATLRPPMRLAASVKADTLLQRLEALAARHAPFDLPRLAVARMADFLALRPSPDGPAEAMGALQSLADDALTSLDDLRAEADPVELARRGADARLDAEQRALLHRWGYPHVLHRWRFHLTLTDGLEPAERTVRQAKAVAHFAGALTHPAPVRDLCLYIEPAAGAPLQLIERLALSNGHETVASRS
ncbi:DUF1045 domain-containing protein [Leptothrix discophora]|uniref:DUF1045 domain-containing protein n=1 Tax=Leptothrix discophora TaxID=89 RepID=A0ABT9G6H4_LEPDI|nr:DUF1045 domain-containing protein [Leptothrix discophora]MDP4302086.1 DUF1045 domain-containing protein [Leptothrix discophora]